MANKESSLNQSKKIFRDEFKKIRDSIPKKSRDQFGKRIAEKLIACSLFRKAKTVGLYLHKGSEVQTTEILKSCHQLGKRVAAPKLLKKNSSIQFFLIARGLQDCKKGAYDIPEPQENCPLVPKRQLDILIVPGIAFDRKGFRIGYGGGSYDRFLQTGKAPTVGFSYERTLTRSLPKGKKDIPLQYVITEKKLYRIRDSALFLACQK